MGRIFDGDRVPWPFEKNRHQYESTYPCFRIWEMHCLWAGDGWGKGRTTRDN